MTDNNSEKFFNKNNIIFLDVGDSPTLESVEKMMREAGKKARELEGEALVLIKSDPKQFYLLDSKFRKRIAHIAREILKESRFKKIAVFGGNTLSITTTSFVLAAIGFGNIRIFGSEKEALEWLRKP